MNHFLPGLLLMFLPFNIPRKLSVFKLKAEKITKKVEKLWSVPLSLMRNSVLYIVLEVQPVWLVFECMKPVKRIPCHEHRKHHPRRNRRLPADPHQQTHKGGAEVVKVESFNPGSPVKDLRGRHKAWQEVQTCLRFGQGRPVKRVAHPERRLPEEA
jgi:hypothetical protein